MYFSNRLYKNMNYKNQLEIAKRLIAIFDNTLTGNNLVVNGTKDVIQNAINSKYLKDIRSLFLRRPLLAKEQLIAVVDNFKPLLIVCEIWKFFRAKNRDFCKSTF